MKIEYKYNSDYVSFCNLKVGEIFTKEGAIFMKLDTNSFETEDKAIVLSDDDDFPVTYIFDFKPNDIVELLNCKLVVE